MLALGAQAKRVPVWARFGVISDQLATILVDGVNAGCAKRRKEEDEALRLAPRRWGAQES